MIAWMQEGGQVHYHMSDMMTFLCIFPNPLDLFVSISL
jgi:hypothetical protein